MSDKIQSDTREKLEADIEGYFSSHLFYCMRTKKAIRSWLDRQATITERNWIRICAATTDANIELKRQIDELETKLDEVTGNFNMAMSCKRKWRDRYYELQAKHKLPYGVEWPKFKDGTPVNIGDEVPLNGHTKKVYMIRFFDNGVDLGVEEDNCSHAFYDCSHGKKVERPEKEDSIEHVLADLRNNGIDSIADRIERLMK